MKLKLGRKLFAFLFTLAMVIGLMPGMSMTAYADGNVASVKVGETTTQYSTFAEAVTAWNNAANGATLTLLADVTTTSTISVSGTKTLDLNGYGIKMTANYRVFLISAGADMTMIDSNATRTGTGDNRPSNIVGGYVTGGRVLDASGGAILVNSNGKCTMTGGTICGNEAARQNAGYNYGGGVCVDGGYFEMTGGAIINNKAQYGGAVQVQNCTADGNGFVFGGTALLSENSCTDDGGGINIGRNGVVSITGGTITGNTATGKGGGIAFRSGGSSLSISGSPVISGNINDNIYLYSNKKITVSGELSNTTPIGITMQSLGVFTNSSNTEYNDPTRFRPDNSDQIIGKDANGQLLIGSTSNTVTVTPSSNMTKTTDSGEVSQTVVTNGVMTDVVYTADDGYYFPTDYRVDAVSGITVTRNGYTQITVSGTPTANAEITLTAPTAKTTPDAPTTAAALDCTTADNNDGKLTSVTTAMEYKKLDADNWTDGTGSDIIGLVPGTYYVRVKATDTTNASANQELKIKEFISYTVTFKVVNGKWNEGEGDAATTDKAVTLTGHDGDTLKLTADQIPAVGDKPNDTYKAGSWDVTPSTDTAITEATTYTYVAKEAAVVTKAPEAKTLTYTGSAQELVTAGEATGGEMQYALGTATKATQPYTTSIPTSTDAGTYYVWYKVVGDEKHTDTEPECIKVTIAEKEESDTSIETKVNVSDDAPAVKVDNLDEELAVELLTDEEKEAYNQGAPVLVYLDVKTLAKADVPAIDLEAVEKVTKKDDYTYGECLDISLWKRLGNGTPTQISDTNGNLIKITVTIPDTMKSAPAGYTRTFRIIRVHNGVATVMAEGTGATLEVSSDKFSSYFLVYKDTKGAATTEATTATSTTEAATVASTSDATTATSTTEAAKTSPKTGDAMPIAVLIVLMLSAAGVLVFMDQKKKKN